MQTLHFFNRFNRTSTMVLVFQLLFCIQNSSAQFSSETFNLQKASELYDERGFMKGKSLSVDGNLILNNSNGTISYTYPISSFTVHGYPMNVSLNYCGSVGFTSFQSYCNYNTESPWACASADWSKINQNRPLWIIGLNGFAVQTLSQNTEPVCPPKSITDYFTSSAEYYVPPVWLVDGYDFCNRMHNFNLSIAEYINRVDVIKLLRSDGSILELCNHSDSSTANMVTEPSFYSGMYFEKGTNTKGYARVELKENRTTALKSRLVFPLGTELTSPIQMPRVVHYFPGDGLEYIFREDVAPYGSQFYSGAAGAQWAGSGLATPTIFYLDEIRSQKYSITELNYEYDSSIESPKIYKGRHKLAGFFGHQFTFGGYRARIESFGKTTDIVLDTILRNSVSDYDIDNPVVDNWLPTSLPMIKKIIDPAGRQVSFSYGTRTRYLEGYKWPYSFNPSVSCDIITGTTPKVQTTTQRMIRYNEPLSYTQISYFRNDSTVVLNGTNTAKDLCQLSDVAKQLLTLSYNAEPLITKEFGYNALDTSAIIDMTNSSGWSSYFTITDNISNKKTFTTSKYVREKFLPEGIYSYIPGQTFTDLVESIEGTEDQKTKTETTYDWIYKSGNDILNIRLPILRKVTEISPTDVVIRSYSTFDYVVDTTVHYQMSIPRKHYGFGVIRQYENVWRPDTTTKLLYRKVTDYEALKDTTVSDVLHSGWNKIKSLQNYYELKASDPSFTKTWEECLEERDSRIMVYGTPDSISTYIPAAYRDKSSFITDGDSINYASTKGKILQGVSKKYFPISVNSNALPIDRVMVIEDTVLGLGGKSYVSNRYIYPDSTSIVPIQSPVSIKNAHNSISDFRYSYQGIPSTWECSFNSNGLPTGKIRRNDNTDSIGVLHGGEQLLWWHEPLAKAKRIRRYLPGHSVLDTMILPTVFERTYYGLHSGVIDPNGWLTSARYDEIGRLLKIAYPYDYNSSSHIVEREHTVRSVREGGYTIRELKQLQHRKLLPDTNWQYRTITERSEDYSTLHAERLYAHSEGGGSSAKKGEAKILVTDSVWTEVSPYRDTLYYGFIPFRLRNDEIESLDSAVIEITPTIIDPCFSLFIAGEKVTSYIPYTYTQVLTNSLSFNCDSSFTDTSQLLISDTGIVSRSGDKIRIKLSSTLVSAIASGNVDLNVKLSPLASYLAGYFHNIGDDVMPQIKLYGIFKNDIDLTDYTLKYIYGDHYGKYKTNVYAKTDDTLHTSNAMATHESASDNKRVSAITNLFRSDNSLTESILYRGNPADNIQEKVSFVNNGLGKPLTSTDQLGYVSRIFYDDLGRVTKVNNPDNVSSSGDTNSTVTTNYYIGVPTKYGIGSLDQDFYGFCSVKSVTNENGIIFSQYTDAFGRLRREVADSGGYTGNFTTRYDYDILGRLTKVVNPEGQITNYWYDDFGRVKYKKQPDIGILSYGYDAIGNVRFTQTNEQDSLGKLTFHQYDDLNRITVVGEARLGAITHDTLPNLHRWTDVLDPNTLHDSGNSAILTANKTLWSSPYTGVPNIPYNATSSACLPVATYSDEDYLPTVPTFMMNLGTTPVDTLIISDSTNFENIATRPQNVRIVIHYDTLPQRSGAIWGNFTPTGLTKVWDSLSPTYKVRNMKGHEVAVAYREKASEPFHYVVMSYDERGRVEALLRFTGNIGFDAVYYSYNSANQVIRVVTADGQRQHCTWYGYDWNGRIDSVWTKLGSLGSGIGLTSPKYPTELIKPSEGLSIVYRYDSRGLVDSTLLMQPQILQQNHYGARKWLDSMSAKRGVDMIFNQKLTFDKVGNIVEQKSTQGTNDELTMQYQYDEINRLALWRTSQWSHGERYDYDKVGNRTSQQIFNGSDVVDHTNSYDYLNGNNQLTKVTYPTTSTEKKYQYTGDGSLRVREKETSITSTYKEVKWDVFRYGYNGLLKTFGSSSWSGSSINCARDTNAHPQWQWEYRYSASGERERKKMTVAPLDGILTTSHLWTYYLLGGNKQQLAVYNGRETSETDACSNTEHRIHFYPTEYLTYGNGTSALITTRPNGKAEYKIVDHLGSTRVVLNDTGKVISQYDYEPFGKPLAKAGLGSRKSFIDREKDKESGLGNFGVRSYDDEVGLFTSIDPLWENYRAYSPYNYCGNNPLTLSDPSGMFWGPIIGIGFAIIADVIAATQLAVAPTFDKEGDAKKIANAKTEIAVIGVLSGGMGLAADATLVKGAVTKLGEGRVFWSGGKIAKNAAGDFAKANGLKTLEMTKSGKVMDVVNPFLPRSISSPIWNKLSKNFASGAKGEVNFFTTVTGPKATSIWLKVEKPILDNNAVKIIPHIK